MEFSLKSWNILTAPSLARQTQLVLIMKKNLISSLILCASLGLGVARATTVIPPSFDELVGEAEIIFQGTVTEVKSQWTGEGGERHIVTYVSFQVEDAVKGNPGAAFTMRMLGGTVDGTTMEVTDSPKFKVGEREILFVEHNGTQFIPLVGIMHGRFHVAQDASTGTEMVLTNSGQTVTNLAQLGKEDPLEHSEKNRANTNAPVQSLDTNSFKSAIRAKLNQS